MPSKKKKYNARFPAGRIKKIMQTDEEIGKVAQAVPVIISRTLELFVESLLKRAMQIINAKNAKTLTPTHMKQCILSESRFDFLKDLVKGIPDVSTGEDDLGTPSGTLSPGTPLSGKSYSSYSCFQFQQSSDSCSSRTSGASSNFPVPQTSQPKFYKEIPIGSEDSGSRSSENSASSFLCRTSVIQHSDSQLPNHCSSFPPNSKEPNPTLIRTISGRNITQLNELKLSNCIKMSDNTKSTSEIEEVEEEEEEEDSEEDTLELEENGYLKKASIAKALTIDEDYDT